MSEDIKLTIRWSMIAAAAAAFIMLAQVVGALGVFEPWLPATHGWVRAWAQPHIDERNNLIANAQLESNEKFEGLSREQNEIKRLVFQTMLTGLQSELITLEISLRDRPTDQILLARKRNVESQISDIMSSIRIITCELTGSPRC